MCSAYLWLCSHLQLMCYIPVLCGKGWFSAGVCQGIGTYLCTPVIWKLLCAPHLSGYESLILNSVVLLACVSQHPEEIEKTWDCAACHPDGSEEHIWAHSAHLSLPSAQHHLWDDSNTSNNARLLQDISAAKLTCFTVGCIRKNYFWSLWHAWCTCSRIEARWLAYFDSSFPYVVLAEHQFDYWNGFRTTVCTPLRPELISFVTAGLYRETMMCEVY